MDLQFERSPPRCGSVRRRQGCSGSGLLLMDCLCPDMATTQSVRMATIRHRGSQPIGFRPSRADVYGTATWPCRQASVPVQLILYAGLGTVHRMRPSANRERMGARVWLECPILARRMKDGHFAHNCFSCRGRAKMGDLGCHPAVIARSRTFFGNAECLRCSRDLARSREL